MDRYFEQVAIDVVHVGDFVFIDQPIRPADARCVIAKRSAKKAGWLVELVGGDVACWPRGASVWRRRT